MGSQGLGLGYSVILLLSAKQEIAQEKRYLTQTMTLNKEKIRKFSFSKVRCSQPQFKIYVY